MRCVVEIKYTAMEIANYIVWYANNGITKPVFSLTPLKLQKILYYVTTAYLKKYDELLFSESFRKWQYGPVVKEVYFEFKSVGICHIDKPKAIIVQDDSAIFGRRKVEFSEHIFDQDLDFKIVADSVINQLIYKDAFELVEMTHEEKAWSSCEPEIITGLSDLKYSREELLEAKTVLIS